MSFFVQNYSKSVPFLIKTKRYYLNVQWCGVFILSYFLRFLNLYFNWVEKNLNFYHVSNILFNKFFVKSTYRLYKKVFFKRFGLYTNLQTKSLITKILQNWTKDYYIGSFSVIKSNSIICHSVNPFFKYLVPISLSHISLKKKNYNILIYYLITLFVLIYPTTIYSFVVWNTTYNYIPHWFFLYTFPRKYFFKVHSY